MTDDQRAALDVLQADFKRTLQHQWALELARLEGKKLGLSFASHENVRQYAGLGWFWKQLQGGYYARLDARFLQEYATLMNQTTARMAEMAEPVTLRGVGLALDGKPIYWYARADKVLPLSLAVAHDDAAATLQPVLWAIKLWLHKTYPPPNRAAQPFPTTWGVMTLSAHPEWGPTLVEGRPTKDGNAYDYTLWPLPPDLNGAVA